MRITGLLCCLLLAFPAALALAGECAYYGEINGKDSGSSLSDLYRQAHQPLLFVMGSKKVFVCADCNAPSALAGSGDQAQIAGLFENPRLQGATDDESKVAGSRDKESLQAGVDDKPRIAGTYADARLGGEQEKKASTEGGDDKPRIAGTHSGALLQGVAADDARADGSGDMPRIAGAVSKAEVDATEDDEALIAGNWEAAATSGAEEGTRLETGRFLLSCRIDNETGQMKMQNRRQLPIEVYDGTAITEL